MGQQGFLPRPRGMGESGGSPWRRPRFWPMHATGPDLACGKEPCEASPAAGFAAGRSAEGSRLLRRHLLLLLKAAISVLLLYFSLRSVSLTVVGERLSRFHPAWIAGALVLLSVQVALLAARW